MALDNQVLEVKRRYVVMMLREIELRSELAKEFGEPPRGSYVLSHQAR